MVEHSQLGGSGEKFHRLIQSRDSPKNARLEMVGRFFVLAFFQDAQGYFLLRYCSIGLLISPGDDAVIL